MKSGIKSPAFLLCLPGIIWGMPTKGETFNSKESAFEEDVFSVKNLSSN